MTQADAAYVGVRGPHNKGMNLTSALTRFARWHGQRSQVMPGVELNRFAVEL